MFLLFSTFMTIFTSWSNEPFSGTPNAPAWLLATHGISFIDAAISVRLKNTNNPHKSYFISICGSALFPAIGHTYLGGGNYLRGALYSVLLTELFAKKEYEFVNTVRIISAVDAAVSIVYFNKNITKKNDDIMLVPDISARMLRLVWNF